LCPCIRDAGYADEAKLRVSLTNRNQTGKAKPEWYAEKAEKSDNCGSILKPDLYDGLNPP